METRQLYLIDWNEQRVTPFDGDPHAHSLGDGEELIRSSMSLDDLSVAVERAAVADADGYDVLASDRALRVLDPGVRFPRRHDVVSRVIDADGTPSGWDVDWSTEALTLLLCSDCSPEFPEGMDEAARQDVYDAPWDHPEVLWRTEDGTRLRISYE